VAETASAARTGGSRPRVELLLQESWLVAESEERRPDHSLPRSWARKVPHSFALGDKAVKAALRSNLSPQTIEIIRSAKRYAEGTAVRIEVNTAEDLQDIKTLIAIKIEN